MSPCERVRFPDGGVGFVCHKGPREFCRCGRSAHLLCDGPAPADARRKTCDEPICHTCAAHVAPDLDYCPAHKELAMPRPGGPPPGFIGDLFATPAAVSETLARARHGAPAPEPIDPVRRPDAEPAPNSPEDLGARPPASSGPTCRSCHAPIMWAKLDGKPHPFDPEPRDDGTYVLKRPFAGGPAYATFRRLDEPLAANERRRASHFATCPHADSHRRSR